MRVLRDYINNYKPEKQQAKARKNNEKHPRKLKIINNYHLEAHNIKNRTSSIQK